MKTWCVTVCIQVFVCVRLCGKYMASLCGLPILQRSHPIRRLEKSFYSLHPKCLCMNLEEGSIEHQENSNTLQESKQLVVHNSVSKATEWKHSGPFSQQTHNNS